MSLPTRISFGVILAVLVITGWLDLGTLLLAILFSYFFLRKLDFFKGHNRWLAIGLFILLAGGGAYGLASLVQATAEALPGIAEKGLPGVTEWAREHGVRLPFTDLDSLKTQAIAAATNGAKDIGQFADFARGATSQFIYLTVGCMVAMGLFLNPELEMDHPTRANRNNLYSTCCEEISRRFGRFYESFDIAMNAQVTISAINAGLTAIFMVILGLPHLTVALGLTFIGGLVPVIGNLAGSIVLIAIGFVVSPGKGLAAIVFSAAAHYAGFMVSSKIIGDKIRCPIWLTLLALVVGERLMGVTGMVLAPVLLHYIRIEASLLTVKPTKSDV